MGFFGRLLVGLLESLFKLARQHVFLVVLGCPRIAELIFAALSLFGQNARGIGNVHIVNGSSRAARDRARRRAAGPP
jgi:hypothetical protein